MDNSNLILSVKYNISIGIYIQAYTISEQLQTLFLGALDVYPQEESHEHHQ